MVNGRFRSSILAVAALAVVAAPIRGWTQVSDPPLALFFDAASIDRDTAREAYAALSENWRDGYANMLVDLLDILRRTGFVEPSGFIALARLSGFLTEQTNQEFADDVEAWRRWVWSLPYEPHSDYGEFKGILYGTLDPGFRNFFRPPVVSSIRLDEIQWGGVAVNGIPPLYYPDLIDADDAAYLDDGDIVFGFSINGEARAYPRRILAWHELALDQVGGRELTIVYCTLCGTVIPFESVVGGEKRTFGTSGLLYQSNKLMFDEETGSLWSSLTGEPVVGPLVGSGLRLTALPVVTTTWGQWRRRHPATRVLSLQTGFVRDYSEGAAYRQYFATDALMFDVSHRDSRLLNKAEVLVIRSLSAPDDLADSELPAFAIAVEFLEEHPVHQFEINGVGLIALATAGGANRVYASDGIRFERLDGAGRVIDAGGRLWRIEEDGLFAEFDAGTQLPRVSAHRAFWFGWYAQHPDTVLIR